jgi:putative transposase
MAAMRYVEKNPVRASLVKKAWDWKWSSAGFHTGRSEDIKGLGDIEEIVDLGVDGWEEYLEDDEIREELEKRRKNTMLGRPIGSSRFMAELEKERKRGQIFCLQV